MRKLGETSTESAMTAAVTFEKLLELGRNGRLEEIAALPGAGTHEGVTAVVSRWPAALKFLETLGPEDLKYFTRAVAVFEDTAGGLGSVTLLQHVVPRLEEPDNATVKWIIRNTRSYWYYEDRLGWSEDELGALRQARQAGR